MKKKLPGKKEKSIQTVEWKRNTTAHQKKNSQHTPERDEKWVRRKFLREASNWSCVWILISSSSKSMNGSPKRFSHTTCEQPSPREMVKKKSSRERRRCGETESRRNISTLKVVRVRLMIETSLMMARKNFYFHLFEETSRRLVNESSSCFWCLRPPHDGLMITAKHRERGRRRRSEKRDQVDDDNLILHDSSTTLSHVICVAAGQTEKFKFQFQTLLADSIARKISYHNFSRRPLPPSLEQREEEKKGRALLSFSLSYNS